MKYDSKGNEIDFTAHNEKQGGIDWAASQKIVNEAKANASSYYNIVDKVQVTDDTNSLATKIHLDIDYKIDGLDGTYTIIGPIQWNITGTVDAKDIVVDGMNTSNNDIVIGDWFYNTGTGRFCAIDKITSGKQFSIAIKSSYKLKNEINVSVTAKGIQSELDLYFMQYKEGTRQSVVSYKAKENPLSEVFNFKYGVTGGDGSIIIRKLNAQEKNKINGAKFKVYSYNEDGTEKVWAADQVITNGEARIDGLPVDIDIWVQETQAPLGYKMNSTPIKTRATPTRTRFNTRPFGIRK